MYSINMPNVQQNNIQNEIEQIKQEIHLLQDRLKKIWESQVKESLNQFQNGLIPIKRIRVKKGQRPDFLKPKKYKI